MSGETFRRNATYITPQVAPVSNTCWRIFLPDSEEYKAALNEIISFLTFSEAWVENGGISVELASELYTEQWAKLREDDCMIGTVYPTITANTPDNSLPCDGSTHDRVDYPDLYAILDSAFVVDADTFITPDLRSRVALGAGQASGLSAYAVGALGGFETHTLTTAELAAHTHVDTGHSHTEIIAAPNITTIGAGTPQPTAIPSPGITGFSSAAIASEGGNQAHNNIQPYLALNWCVIAR